MSALTWQRALALTGITYDRFGGYGLFLAADAVASALVGILLFGLPVYPV